MGLDLQSGQSWWLLKHPGLPAFPELETDDAADVVIVGAGITGALAAAMLVEAGVNVLVLDRRAFAQGSTGASTALLSYEPDLSLAELAARRGPDVALESYRAARDANRQLGALIERLGIACDFETASSFHLARTPAHDAKLREEHRLRNLSGLRCEYLTGTELSLRYGLVAESALRTPEAGQVDPVRLTAGLLAYVLANGSRCFRADVTRMDPAERGLVAGTEHGPRVAARRIVLATGYETQLRLRQSTVQLTSTYAIATDVVAPLPSWLRTSILWDMDRPYHYARSADGRILVGGGDEPFVDEAARDALMPQKANELHQYLQTILPGLTTGIATVWCGTFARTTDSLPYIGEIDDMPGVFGSLGYGGNGITGGMLGALALRDWVTGRTAPRESPFSFSRDAGLR